MQGISSKILKNHIFFSHYLALRRKCGKRVGILWRNREFATGTCRARASPTFAKEKSKQPWRWRVLRKNIVTASRRQYSRRETNKQRYKSRQQAGICQYWWRIKIWWQQPAKGTTGRIARQPKASPLRHQTAGCSDIKWADRRHPR